MANHEENGTILRWTRRLVFCRHCKFEYEQEYGKDYSCPACGAEDDYYVLNEYYD